MTMSGRRERLLPCVLMASVLAWQPANAQSSVIDATGSTVVVNDASKILSVGSDITEILYALDADRQIVAVDTTSQYPRRALKEKKSVGYMRALSTEGILSVGATVMIASQRSGPPDVIKALKASSLPVVLLDEGKAAADISKKVRTIGRIIVQEKKAEALAKKIDAEFSQLSELRAKIKVRKRAVFALSVQAGRITVGGRDSSADFIFALAGLENAAAVLTGYKPIGEEGLIEMSPDFLIIPKPRGGGAPEASALKSMSGVRATPAGKAGHIVEMDLLYLLGLGPRTPSAARDLLAMAYPELATTPPR
ncbi:MAG: hemin ABC transporter substrate-binding protein [Hyphomicrobiaceae bacterium]